MANRRNNDKIEVMSKRQRNIIFFAVFLTALGSALAADRTVGAFLVDKAVKLFYDSGGDYEKYHGRAFLCVNVVDGDTIDIDLPDGAYENTRIRLLGVDTPETVDPRKKVMRYGPEATKFTERMCLNKKVRVFTDTISNVRDRYGRLLVYVELENGRVLNEALITNGLAFADTRFGHSRKAVYVELEKQAIVADAGMWADADVGEMPVWVRERYVQVKRFSQVRE